MNPNPLLQIIEEQKKEFIEEIRSASYLVRKEHSCCWDYDNESQIVQGYDDAIKALLQKQVEMLEKNKIGWNSAVTDLMYDEHDIQKSHDDAIQTQINLLQDTIDSIK